MEIAVFVLVIVFIKTHAMESTEDDSETSPYNTYMSSTSNFQDIYTNIFNRNEESTPNEDEFAINTQSVEFHPSVLKIAPITPVPKILLSASLRKKSQSSTVAPTDEPETISVIPLRNIQRGVLDVLFPASRVKSFKNVFDSVRRILSHTF